MGAKLKIAIAESRDVSAVIIAKKLKEKIRFPCSNILLIHPQQVEKNNFSREVALRGRYSAFAPYGCGVLVRNLTQRGYSADILDLNLEFLLAARKEDFDYDFWKTNLREKLDVFKPDLVGISCMFSMMHGMMKEIAHEVKEYNCQLPIICGGVHLSDAKQLALEDLPDIDFMGLYECDQSFPDSIDFVNGKVGVDLLRQIAIMDNGRYIALENRASPSVQEMNTIPLYNDLPIGIYSDLGQVGTYKSITKDRKISPVLTNRGCRAHCSFCTVPELNGKGVIRQRSIDSVTEEIQILYYNYGIRHITWLDDDLLYDSKRIIALFRAIADLKLDLTWDATNGLIAAAIKEDIMEAMIASGCIGFNLGIESGNPQRLKDIHKPGTVETFRKCKALLDKYPQVFTRGYFIIGFPGETVSELLDTVNLGLELQLDWYNVAMLNPLPSTEIYETMLQRGMIEDILNDKRSATTYGYHSRARLREKREKLTAADFFNIFDIGQPEDLIKAEDLSDYEFLMKYKLNHEVILTITNEIKLKKKNEFLANVCQLIAPESIADQLFYGITRYKLGDAIGARKQAEKVRELLTQSAYWQKRFEALDLYPLIDSIS